MAEKDGKEGTRKKARDISCCIVWLPYQWRASTLADDSRLQSGEIVENNYYVHVALSCPKSIEITENR